MTDQELQHEFSGAFNEAVNQGMTLAELLERMREAEKPQKPLHT